MSKSLTAQIRTDLAWLDANGFDTTRPRAELNRHLAAGTLGRVVETAAARIRSQRTRAEGSTVSAQARYMAGQKDLQARGGLRKGRGTKPVTSGILDSIRHYRPAAPGSTRLVRV